MTVTNSDAQRHPSAVGLRAQQKQESRRRIAAAAMGLFAERGFDTVSIAQVAAAAGVSEKTVFNHFATKEDLVYSRDREFEAALLHAVSCRPAGVSAFDAVRAFLLQTYARFGQDAAVRSRAATMATLVSGSLALQAREREILARYARGLRDRLADELGNRPGDLRPAVVAEALIAVHQGVIAGYRRGLLDHEPATTLRRRLRAAAEEAFALLGGGLATLADPSGNDH